MHLEYWKIERGAFTPQVFSFIGGMSRGCSFFYKKLPKKEILTSEK